jgi:hypothetical protein
VPSRPKNNLRHLRANLMLDHLWKNTKDETRKAKQTIRRLTTIERMADCSKTAQDVHP